jgi:hypothetical protein
VPERPTDEQLAKAAYFIQNIAVQILRAETLTDEELAQRVEATTACLQEFVLDEKVEISAAYARAQMEQNAVVIELCFAVLTNALYAWIMHGNA